MGKDVSNSYFSSELQMAACPKRALLIGPNYSPSLPTFCGPLEGVQNDLELMEGMLQRNGFQPQDIKVLEGDSATRDNILASLEELASIAEKRSVVIIYFSGHGYQLDDEFDEGLLPAGLTREMVDRFHINDVCITGEHFKPHLYQLIQKGCMVNTIFDCCFSGRLYRGFVDEDAPTLRPKQLKLTKEYISEYCEILKAKGDPVEHDEPGETSEKISNALQETGDDEPMEHEPWQETKPPMPADQQILLAHPVQEFWNKMWESQGWQPAERDKFIHIGACAANEKGYEAKFEGNLSYGCLTYALVEAVNEVQREGKTISYAILKSLLKQKFFDKNWTGQTPQFEGGELDMVLFNFDTVPHLKAFEICQTSELEGIQRVVLNAGRLHGVVEGEYWICPPEATCEVKPESNRLYFINKVVINNDDIEMAKSRGTVVEKAQDSKIQVGCKAVLLLRHSIFTPVVIKAPTYLEQEHTEQMIKSIDNQDMFTRESEEGPHCITLDITEVEKKQCWRACQYGRMIAPYQEVGDEHQMAKNLSKYFRLKFATIPKQANNDMLTRVSFKLFKVEKVGSFRGDPKKKTELIANAVKTLPDVSGETPPPVFKAHKVELGTSLYFLRKHKVVDGTGDALVIEVTNNENRPIHICIISYQADGSIVVLYPPRKGQTEVLRPKESARTIKRVLLEPDTVRRMVEPDFDKEKPKQCKDVLILYATTEESDYEPLTQTAIELSYRLSTRSPNPPDNLSLPAVSRFRDALRTHRDAPSARDGPPKWLTMKREIIIEYNEDP